jgi:hypothetical protein
VAPKPRLPTIEQVLLALLILYPVLYMFQGLDWTDQGFWTTNYWLVFRAPVSVSSSFNCWLSVVLGGIWMALTGFLGLLSVRLGYVVVTGLTLLLTRAIVRRAFSPPPLVLVSALGVAAAYAHYDELGAMNWLSYNDLTALFLTWAAYHLLRGLKDARSLHLALAGAIVAWSVLVRLPNVVGLGLGLAIVCHGVIARRPAQTIVRQVAWFGAGGLSGSAAAALILIAFGHARLYLASVANLFDHRGNEAGFHSSDQLIGGLVADTIASLQLGIWVLFLCGALFVVSRILARVRSRVALVLLGAIAAWLLHRYEVPYLAELARSHILSRWRWSYTGVAYWALGAMILLPLPGLRGDPDRRVTALVALMVLAMVPAGSGRPALLNAHYGMWLAATVIGAYLFSLPSRGTGLPFAKTACAGVVVLYGTIGLYHHPYRDAQDRARLAYTIPHPRLRGILTTRARAKTITELLTTLRPLVRPRTTLLAFEYIPMLHYLTDTRPYLDNANPMYYTGPQFEEALLRAERRSSAMPLIVAAKGDDDIAWPDDVAAGLANSLPKFGVMRRDVAEFKARHAYRKVWENDFFEVWVPGHQ